MIVGNPAVALPSVNRKGEGEGTNLEEKLLSYPPHHDELPHESSGITNHAV